MRLVNTDDYKVASNGTIDSKGKLYKFSIANIGNTVLRVGVKKGNLTPNLELPPKPEDSPAYSRVFTTDSADLAFAKDYSFEFEGGKGTAEITVFYIATVPGQELTSELQIGQTV